MRQRLHHIIYIAMAALLMTGCTGKDSRNLSDIPDEQVFDHSDSLVFAARKTGDYNRMLAVIDSLADAGDFSPIHADNYRCEPYFFLGETEKSLECLRRATADSNPPAEDFWFYVNCGVNLAMLQDGLSDHESAIATALRFIGELQQVKSPYRANGLKSFYFFLGHAQMSLERHTAAAESFNEAYRWLRLIIENDSTGSLMPGAMLTLDNTAIAYFDIHQPDEAEKWVNREDSILAVYRQIPEADSTEIEVFRAYILLDRARICQAHGQQDQADRYYAEYTQTDRGKDLQGYIFGGRYLMQAHRYADAADVFQELDHYLDSYGIDYNLEVIGGDLIPKFNVNYYAGRKDSALQVALKIAEVYDSAFVMQKRSDAANLATLYDVQGKERQIVEQRAGKRLFTAISIAVAIIALLAGILAVYFFRQQRIIQKKNRVLVEQMTEAVEYKRMMEEGRSKSGASDEEQVELTSDEIVDFDALTTDELSQHIRSVIIRERLYLNTQFDRQAAIDYFHLSKERIGAAFSQGSEFPTIADFINHCRLEYAKELLAVSPEMTVDDIASASGFGTRRTFSRLFKERYSITPTEYRNQNV